MYYLYNKDIMDLVLKRLKSFKFKILKEDMCVIEFCQQKVENTIKNTCNIRKIPKELYNVATDMICGEFLMCKKNTGTLNDFDLETAVKQIKEGDTTVTYALSEGSLTPEQRLDFFINHLLNGNRKQLVSHRRLKW